MNTSAALKFLSLEFDVDLLSVGAGLGLSALLESFSL
ncbi:hypothetical protein SAJ_1847 [Streptococcus agalactiae 18RS21]|nr:hypothetical protein SAJ_1847 [Streptococcus agalactiae 18RS21]EAO70330.1 hypothetical protein SAL_1985 [Streptococcus agalactiae 515]